MALLERNPSGKNWAGRRSIKRWGMAAALVLPSLFATACSDALGIEGTPTKDYTLVVDCAANPQATAEVPVVQLSEVQLVMITVSGTGYTDKWRLQIMPPASDLRISQPNGGEPSYDILAGNLETGKPQLTPLKHGAIIIKQVAPEAIPTASLLPSASSLSLPTQPTGPVLEVELSCQSPPAGQ